MKAIDILGLTAIRLSVILLAASTVLGLGYGQQAFNSNTGPITTENLVTYAKHSNFIKEFPVPIQEHGLKGVTVDPQGNPWIYYSTNRTTTIFKFDPTKQTFSQYPITGQTVADDPIINLAACHLVYDNATNSVWFADARTNSMGKLDVASGNAQLLPIPTKNAGPMGIVLSPDGKSIWFAEINGNNIGKVDLASMKITEYSAPQGSGPALLSFDDKGILWVSLSFANSVLRVDPNLLSFANIPAAITELKISGKDTFSPLGIAVVGNKVYVSDHGSSRVIVTDVGFSNYDSLWTSPSNQFPTTLPGEVVSDKQGNVYFAQHGGNRISVIDTGNNIVTEYEIPSGPLSTTLFLTASSDGKAWFTEWASNKLGYLDTSIKVPFDMQINSNPDGLTLTGAKPESIDLSLSRSSNTDNNSTVSTSDIKVKLIGMTENGMRGVGSTLQPSDVNLDQAKHATVRMNLTTQDGGIPGKYTLMVEATAMENDGLTISKLYPVPLALDVQAPAGQDNNPLNTSNAQMSPISLGDVTRLLATIAAVGLVGYLILKRVRKRPGPSNENM